jgi:hypothetical protein
MLCTRVAPPKPLTTPAAVANQYPSTTRAGATGFGFPPFTATVDVVALIGTAVVGVPTLVVVDDVGPPAVVVDVVTFVGEVVVDDEPEPVADVVVVDDVLFVAVGDVVGDGNDVEPPPPPGTVGPVHTSASEMTVNEPTKPAAAHSVALNVRALCARSTAVARAIVQVPGSACAGIVTRAS